jgi:hypothetical protein
MNFSSAASVFCAAVGFTQGSVVRVVRLLQMAPEMNV